MMGAMSLVTLNTPWAHALSPIPREETWITNGTILTIARTTDTVYIGRDFSYVGPATGGGVPIDTSTGVPIPPFPKINGSVMTCVPDGSGGWYIGGYFTSIGGDKTRSHFAQFVPEVTPTLTQTPTPTPTLTPTPTPRLMPESIRNYLLGL